MRHSTMRPSRSLNEWLKPFELEPDSRHPARLVHDDYHLVSSVEVLHGLALVFVPLVVP